jgi:hypothetical protein
MNNVGKPALYGLTHSTIGTFFSENHLTRVNKEKCRFQPLNTESIQTDKKLTGTRFQVLRYLY